MGKDETYVPGGFGRPAGGGGGGRGEKRARGEGQPPRGEKGEEKKLVGGREVGEGYKEGGSHHIYSTHHLWFGLVLSLSLYLPTHAARDNSPYLAPSPPSR
jgi:hypothetical protein